MNDKGLVDSIINEMMTHGRMSVYTTDDAGRLVPVEGVDVITMRDGGEIVPVLVIKR